MTIKLIILTIVVVTALTFTAFADSKEDSNMSTVSGITEISSGCENSSGVTSRDPQGFIWMDIENIRNEIDTLVINRYDEEINSESYTIPTVYFDTDKFYQIMEIAGKYDWTEHREHMYAYQFEACELTVIGHDLVYTYLVFGRYDSGKCFIWSFYDYMITYPSEQDFAYIEELLAD